MARRNVRFEPRAQPPNLTQREADARLDQAAREDEGWSDYCPECGEPLAICIGDPQPR